MCGSLNDIKGLMDSTGGSKVYIEGLSIYGWTPVLKGNCGRASENKCYIEGSSFSGRVFK